MNADPRLLAAAADHRGFLAGCYNRTASLLLKVRARLERECPGVPAYARDAAVSRLVQEVRLLLDEPLRRIEAQRALRGEAPMLTDAANFTCGGLRVDAASGRVRPTLRVLLGALAGFLGLWAACAAATVAGMFARSRIEAGLLVFGVPEEGLFRDGDDAAFAAFACQGPIEPLRTARSLVVQTVTVGARSTAPRILYARHPLLALLLRSRLGLVESMALLARHAATALQFLWTCARFPLFAILWRDYAFHAPAAGLAAAGRIDGALLTNTNLGRQLLCLADLPGKPFPLHLVFYSEHDRPTNYVDVGEKHAVAPALPFLRAHEVWAWTPGRADMIAQQGLPATVHVVGPILWEIPDPASLRRERQWISVFDITPLTDAATVELGLLGNYYSADNMVAFLDGIEEAMRLAGLRLPVVLKPKRHLVAAKSDARYLSRLDGDAAIRQLPPSTSVYSVVAKSAVVIVYPFTTVAYVAEQLGVPAIFFDPTGRREGLFEPGRHIRYASGIAQLATALQEVFAMEKLL